MAIPSKVLKFLENTKAKYELIEHRTVFTAYDKASTLKMPQKTVGKTLVMKVNGNLALVTIPANRNLDKQKLKKAAKALSAQAGNKIDFATERLIRNRFKGVKVGAIPPFGIIWKVPTFVDNSLLKLPKVVVNSGDYSRSLRISSSSIKKLVPDLIKGSFGKVK